MRKVIPKNIADEMTQPYIDDAVEKQIKAANVPPRNKLNISFENADRTDDNKEYKSNQEAYEKNHGKLYDMTHNNTIPWKNYVVYIVLLSLLTCVFTFSKYMSSASYSGDATVAKFNIFTSAKIENDDISIDTNKNIKELKFTDSNQSKTLTLSIRNDSDVTANILVTKAGSSTYTGNVAITPTVAQEVAPGSSTTFSVTVTSPSTIKEKKDATLIGNTSYYSAGNIVFNVNATQVD